MPASFTVQSSAFSGPLDALLDMIEARKLPISSVSLIEVTDAYLAYVRALPEMPLGETAQFVLVAATLLLIKSRSLLPTLTLTQEEELSVEELERRLKQLRIYREAAKHIKKIWGVAPLMLALRAPARPIIFAPGEVSPHTIAHAAHKLLASLPMPESLQHTSVAPVIALEDVIAQLRDRLDTAVRTSFRDMIRHASSKHEVIIHFLAVLELVRSGGATVTQDILFEDIIIEAEQIGLPRYGM